MNAIRATQALNKRELEAAVPPSASWHADYRDTAYVYIGGLPPDLSEGDVVTIFSQFGNPTHLNLVREKDTGKSRGFAFLKYEDQRSCDLAVDNLGGAEVLGRVLRVDHSRYKKREGEDEETWRIERLENEGRGEEVDGERDERRKRRRVDPGKEVRAIEMGGDDEDPMRGYLDREKRGRDEDGKRKHRHHHRSRREKEGDGEDRRHKSSRRRDDNDESGDDRKKHRSRRDDGDDEHGRRKRREGDDDDERRSTRDDKRERRHRRDEDDDTDRNRRRRSRSPDDRDRRRKDTARDRDVKMRDDEDDRGYSSRRDRSRDRERRRRDTDD